MIEDRRAAWSLSGEVLAYIALVVLALVLRIAQLDVVPMTPNEARQALAAWRVVYPDAAGAAIVPDSPLLFALHTLGFSLLGASEFSARIFTALAGIGLALSPLLFRDFLGRARAFLFSLLLTFSPVLLMASRTDSAGVWTMLAVMIALAAFWRYQQSGQGRHVAVSMAAVAAMLFLTEPSGPVAVVVLLVALLGLIWSRRGLDDDEGLMPPLRLPGRDRTWPWASGALAAGILVVIVATLFTMYPSGLSGIGELLNGTLRGLTTARPLIPPFFPLAITLFYEPVLVVAGLIAVVVLFREGFESLMDRFFLGWLIAGTIAGAAYAGSGPEQALWIVIPLAGLTSGLLYRLLSRLRDPLWYGVPGWSRWVLMLLMIALLSMFTVHAQSVARSLLTNPTIGFQLSSVNAYNMVWLIIIGLFVIIGYFLSSSLWGEQTTQRGALLGVLAFGMVTSLGSGWNAAVPNAGDPVELWNRNATSAETILLRSTLMEMARRESSGFPIVELSVLAPEDGVVAWLLRDFLNARFITEVSAAENQRIVLLPGGVDQPALSSSYVGQRFGVSSVWDMSSLQFPDVLSWWMQRRTRVMGVLSDSVTLWLRQDVYNGVQADASVGP
ncbi:MAG: glycosyltransferase family 39 protein [Anaerolineae bacterium]|nr:glycosyltransferase family 39 protein [Anaerolineae bacterium]